MISTWPQMRSFLLRWETMAVTDIYGDRGGQTAGGISRRYHPEAPVWALVDRGITSGALYEQAIHDWYDTQYRDLFETMPSRVGGAYIDALVNMGDGKPSDESLGAAELLQTALNRAAGSNYVKVDGDIGSKTRLALRHCDADAVAFCLCALRLAEYGRRGRKGDERRVFLDGWINRVRALMEEI